MPWVWSWVQTASGGVFCRIARADSGLRAPQRRRFSTTSFRPFTGSALARKSVRPGLLAKRVPVRDPWRSSISIPSCTSCISGSSRSLSGFTVRRTARGFSAKTRTQAAYPTPPRTSAPAIRVPTRIPTWTATATATATRTHRLPRNPRLAWRGGVWHLLRVEVPCVSTSPFRQSD